MKEEEKIDCYRCRYFFVTWDKYFPMGCKAFGFKSRDLPSSVVYRSSGIRCQKFEEKKRH